MILILSLVTSVKDYFEIVHKFIEYDSVNINYTELGSILTYFLISIKNYFIDFLSFSWLLKEHIWSLPIIIPEISSAMISEISVLNGYFHNAFNFLDAPISFNTSTLVTQQNSFLACIDKFIIGGINSFFLFLPTSTAHIITLRRFVMQGLEAGYISGLGTIAGNLFWLGSVILGFRFFVIPWLSLDIFRYLLGFILLVKYMWDTYNEKKIISNVENGIRSGFNETKSNKTKFFLLNFLLALTEQTSIYPFISNISISPETSILENFSLTSIQTGEDSLNSFLYIAIHLSYLLGITIGSLSLLHLSCWFWENPAFKLYMWVISSFKVSTSFYYKALNFIFLYLTMLSAVCSIPYYGLDYTITNPLGYVNDDRLIQDKVVLETSFLGTKASDRNTRRNRGRHGRRERWKRRIRKYRTFDASLYDQGIYDLFTIEDLNYGFDRFWLRRKLRNHRVRFRFFPGPWMRSFKKQLAKPRLESYTGPRIEFFRILYEQVYHPAFHAYNSGIDTSNKVYRKTNNEIHTSLISNSNKVPSSIILKENSKKLNLDSSWNTQSLTRLPLHAQKSTIRKFIRKFDSRVKKAQINLKSSNKQLQPLAKQRLILNKNSWLIPNRNESNNFFMSNNTLNRFNLNTTTSWGPLNSKVQNQKNLISALDPLDEKQQEILINSNLLKEQNLKSFKTYLSKKDSQILQYRTLLTKPLDKDNNLIENNNIVDKSLMLLHPLKFYLQQETAFKRKLRYYTPNVFRKFSVENNAPYYRVMMKRYFYNFKPTSRWERTMKVASLRKARRKTTRIPRKLQKIDSSISLNLNINNNINSVASLSDTKTIKDFNSYIPLEKASIQKSTYNYSVVSKKASRYRYQIYKDVLQHWYYSPFNRFLLKFDVDNFIKRQPNTHFLTGKEENLLHLRRFLLFEHYNTLRWYTNMEHYRSMKTLLNGGTKSFSSRSYNQQFFGTFKKIRHLFAITPSISTISNLSLKNNLNSNINLPTETDKQNLAILQQNLKLKENIVNQTNVIKFDQLLYNEYPNNKDNSLLNPLIIHEELIPDYVQKTNKPKKEATLNGDLLSQSQEIVRKYLIETRSIRVEYIKKLLTENNYSTLTQFFYKGQKTRGNEAITNQKSLNKQEKEYLLTPTEKKQIEDKLNNDSLIETDVNLLINKNLNLNEQLYFIYLKNWKRRINDQDSMKNYLTRRLDKREKRKQKKEKQLFTKLKHLENVYLANSTSSVNSSIFVKNDSLFNDQKIKKNQNKNDDVVINNSSSELLTTGLQKSIIDGMYTLDKLDPKATSLDEINLWKVLLLSKIKQKQNLIVDQSGNITNSVSNLIFTPNSLNRLQHITLNFNDLQMVKKIQLSNDIKTTVQTIRNILKKSPNSKQKKDEITSKLTTSLTANTSLYNSIKKKLTHYRKISLRSILKTKDSFLNVTKIMLIRVKTNLLKSTKRKTLKDWGKKERVLGKQKRSRKEFKLLNKKSEFISSSLDSNELAIALENASRKKRDYLFDNQEKDNNKNNNEQNYITNLFKRKRSPQRRSRIRRSRGIFKKRTLTDSLRKEFTQFLNEKNITEKNQYLNKFHKNLYGTSFVYDQDAKETPLKQRKSKQRKERYWKQKRSKYSQKRRKYRKRRRYTVVKIRNLNKQFKRIKNQITIQNWWWKQFVPSVQASNEALWQIERDKLIQEKLSQLSSSDILKRDKFENSNFDLLQIGNKDFKPLSIPQAIRLIEAQKIKQEDNSLAFINQSENFNLSPSNSSSLVKNTNTDYVSNTRFNLINKLYESLFIKDKDINSNSSFNEFLLPNTNLPFYAGWDESLRKLIVTNRMLSRKEAGFTLDNNFEYLPKNRVLTDTNQLDKTDKLSEFTSAPLQGMNAATTLYWQIPFTTYDPDQFFALGMDGFSPIAWRKFLFRHSILKTWLDSRSSQKSSNFSTYNNEDNFIHTSFKTNLPKYPNSNLTLVVKNKTNIINEITQFGFTKQETLKNSVIKSNLFKQHKNSFAISRRLKKRYRRVKKHPRTPVWFPSGPLANQVLPVHYIYVFYKRSRLPRDRYLKRRLLNIKNQDTTVINNFVTNYSKINTLVKYDFTLRKRLKPKRKYHLKRDYYASNVIIPRRLKFIATNQTITDLKIWRPLDSLKIHKPIAEVVKEQQLLRRSALQKQRSGKQQPNMRVKQLRRRVQRQVLRTVWRYRPRAGGFVWPGDYLKLELVKAPKLQSVETKPFNFIKDNMNNINKNTELVITSGKQTSLRKQKRKKKRNLVEWQIQPKKYLYEKHNLKVLKKKLQKAQRLTGSYNKIINVLRNSI